jgi:hypothetical protein
MLMLGKDIAYIAYILAQYHLILMWVEEPDQIFYYFITSPHPQPKQ